MSDASLPASDDPLKRRFIPLGTEDLLHVIEMDFAEPWRACPLWVGVRWSAKIHSRLRAELMAADKDEATAWVRRRARRQPDATSDPECGIEASFLRAGAKTYVAAHRVKRVMGF